MKAELSDFWALWYADRAAEAERERKAYQHQEEMDRLHPPRWIGETSWKQHVVTRAISDRRGPGAVWRDALAEYDDRASLMDEWVPAKLRRAIVDENEAQARYDDFDEGGTRGGRE